MLLQIADIRNLDSKNRGRVGENRYFVWVTERKHSWVQEGYYNLCRGEASERLSPETVGLAKNPPPLIVSHSQLAGTGATKYLLS